MNQTYMKEQPVLKLILSMALPMVISMMVNSLYNIVDSFFVAQISEKAMTALSLVYPVQNLSLIHIYILRFSAAFDRRPQSAKATSCSNSNRFNISKVLSLFILRNLVFIILFLLFFPSAVN